MDNATSNTAVATNLFAGSPNLGILIAVILIAGLIGGYAQYLSQPPQPAPGPVGQGGETPVPVPAPSLPLMLLLGVIASACVPLFLSLVKGTLVKGILAGTDDPLESLLVFTGLCLVAAFSARRFIDAVSASVLRRLEQVEGTAVVAKENADEAKKTAKEVAREVDSEAADDPREAPPPEAAEEPQVLGIAAEPQPVTPEERKVLEALTKRTYRTRSGIAEDGNMLKSRVERILEGLAQRKLALPTTSPSTGGRRWIITRRGNEALGTQP